MGREERAAPWEIWSQGLQIRLGWNVQWQEKELVNSKNKTLPSELVLGLVLLYSLERLGKV